MSDDLTEGIVRIGTDVYEVTYVPYDLLDSGSVSLAAAVEGSKIRLICMHVQSAGVSTLTIEANVSGAVSGAFQLAAGRPVVLPYNPGGWAESPVGETLVITQTGTGQVSGSAGVIRIT